LKTQGDRVGVENRTLVVGLSRLRNGHTTGKLKRRLKSQFRCQTEMGSDFNDN